MKTTKLYILCGIPFSGKTTLAKKLVEKLGCVHIDLDEVKTDIFGPQISDSSIDQGGWDRIYTDMYQRIRQSLQLGESVVNDTGNFTLAERNLVRKIATDLGIDAVTIFVSIPKAEAYGRLLANRRNQIRFDVSDFDFESTTLEMEVPTAAENHLVYDWQSPMDGWIDKNFGI